MTNRYTQLSLDRLASQCHRLAAELGTRRVRSRDEREQLAGDVRDLLLAVAHHFHLGNSIPGTPENELAHSAVPNVVESFGNWYRGRASRDVSNARAEALRRAADYVLGDTAGRWLRPMYRALRETPDGSAPYSDDDLMRCLQELEDMRTGKLPRPDMSQVPGLGALDSPNE